MIRIENFDAETCESWSRMAFKRGCPSLDLLAGESSAAKAHLARCRHCRERMQNLSLYQSILNQLKPSHSGPVAKNPGEICRVKIDSIIIDEESGNFLNPPLVLILEAYDDHARVAQLHDEQELALEGDVSLPAPNNTYFVESWNTYPLMKEFLGPAVGSVSLEFVEKIKKLDEKPLSSPPEASPYESFQALEARVGSAFCQKTMGILCDREKASHIVEFSNALNKRATFQPVNMRPGAGSTWRQGRQPEYAMAADAGLKEFRDAQTEAKVLIKGKKIDLRGGRRPVIISFRDKNNMLIKIGGNTEISLAPHQNKSVSLPNGVEIITPFFN